MGKLTTHVLNLCSGVPAAGMRVDLLQAEGAVLGRVTTNEDGRVDVPLLAGAAFVRGRYTLLFHVAEYFRAQGVQLPEPPFLEQVRVEFGIADPQQNCHVPLLVTPWSYSTYRGS